MTSSKTGSLTRRELLRRSAAGAALLGVSGCAADPDVAEISSSRLRPPESLDDGDWASIRARFLLDPGIAYMNNASLGVPPRPVVEAVAAGHRAISEEPLHGKHDLQAQIAEVVEPGLARFFGVTADELSLTRNASEALHLQTIGLQLESGDEVLITTQEHPAGRRPWLFRAAREGVRVNEVFIPSPLPDPAEVLSRMADAITPRTRAIAFCHVTRGGHIYPVAELCALARDRGLVSLVDGAQAVGQFPIDLSTLGCDAYSVSLHKWMLAPAGTGFLFVRESARDRIRTAFAYDASPDAPLLAPPGTMPFPVLAAISAALDFVNAIGIERVEARCRFLSDHLKRRLAEMRDITLLSSAGSQSAPGSTIFEKRGLDAMAAVPMMEMLAATHIDEHQRDSHDAIRVSTHIYNTTAEIDRFIDALGRASA